MDYVKNVIVHCFPLMESNSDGVRCKHGECYQTKCCYDGTEQILMKLVVNQFGEFSCDFPRMNHLKKKSEQLLNIQSSINMEAVNEAWGLYSKRSPKCELLARSPVNTYMSLIAGLTATELKTDPIGLSHQSYLLLPLTTNNGPEPLNDMINRRKKKREENPEQYSNLVFIPYRNRQHMTALVVDLDSYPQSRSIKCFDSSGAFDKHESNECLGLLPELNMENFPYLKDQMSHHKLNNEIIQRGTGDCSYFAEAFIQYSIQYLRDHPEIKNLKDFTDKVNDIKFMEEVIERKNLIEPIDLEKDFKHNRLSNIHQGSEISYEQHSPSSFKALASDEVYNSSFISLNENEYDEHTPKKQKNLIKPIDLKKDFKHNRLSNIHQGSEISYEQHSPSSFKALTSDEVYNSSFISLNENEYDEHTPNATNNSKILKTKTLETTVINVRPKTPLDKRRKEELKKEHKEELSAKDHSNKSPKACNDSSDKPQSKKEQDRTVAGPSIA